MDCDFIPLHYREEQSLRRAIKLRAIGLGAMFALMGTWVFTNQQRIAGADAMLAEIAEQKSQVGIHAAKKQLMELERADLFDRQRLIDQLSDRSELVVVYSELSRQMPDTVILTSLSLECISLGAFARTEEESSEVGHQVTRNALPSGASSAEPERRMKSELRLTGLAVSQSEVTAFQAALEGSPLFERVRMLMEEPTVWAGRRAERFELSCALAMKKWGES